MIEEETVRLATQDGASVLKWVETLRAHNHYVKIKTSSDNPPPGSGLDKSTFALIIQTRYQRECWVKHGGRFSGIDATHNMTHYENMSLFTLLVRDQWGHGMLAAWMVSSNGTEDTIGFFLQSIRVQNPTVIPKYFMSDKDHAQMNAIKRRYPESAILLCWWHVLHAWQQHFVITVHPEVWDLLKKWVRMTDRAAFWQQWERIKSLAPESVVEYLQMYWMGDENIKLWSAIYRADQNVFQLCDTNMLVEAWHHLLKGTFMQGKRNQRLDHLIHILVDQAIPHFIHKHRRQEFGFEGADLEVKKRLKIEECAKSIKSEQIKSVVEEPDVYQVQSGSNPDVFYRVDLDAYDCSCLSFPAICFCKHICAVQNKFPEIYKVLPTSLLAIHSHDTFEPNGNTSDIGSYPPPDSEIQPQRLDETTTLIQKLSSLTIYLQANPSCGSESLTDLHRHVDVLFAELQTQNLILPTAKKVAPNQNTWTEMAAVMNVAVKSKRKKNTDQYGGGEHSGKKARPDA